MRVVLQSYIANQTGGRELMASAISAAPSYITMCYGELPLGYREIEIPRFGLSPDFGPPFEPFTPSYYHAIKPLPVPEDPPADGVSESYVKDLHEEYLRLIEKSAPRPNFTPIGPLNYEEILRHMSRPLGPDSEGD